jgi:DNA-binding MarR family transcriptional regulator
MCCVGVRGVSAGERKQAALLLWQVLQALVHDARRRMEPMLRRHGLGSPLQIQVLGLLQCRGPLRQVDLAGVLQLPPSTLSEAVDRLVAEGLLERRSHPEDRRSVLLVLTPHGGQVLAELRDGLADRVAEALAALGEGELAALQAALRALAEHVGTAPGGPPRWGDPGGGPAAGGA